MKKFFMILLLISSFIFSSNLYAQTYVINGDASEISEECFRLTQDAQNQTGSVWYQNLLVLTNDFDLEFDVYFGDRVSCGADGIAFVLQPVSTSLGAVGGGIGYSGIFPSIAVEYDTYQNSDRNDPSDDHIAIQKNGDEIHSSGSLAGPVCANVLCPDIEDGSWHTTSITWDAASNTLSVYFDNNHRLSYSEDIINTIFSGSPNVYWGFTGATSNCQNEQTFCIENLSFAETYCNTPSSPDSPVSLNYAGRTITYSNVSLNGGGNTAIVVPGSTVSIDFDWLYERTTTYCPDCIVQLYWGISGEFSNCFFDQYGYDSDSGSVHGSFTAPTEPGYYYITQQGSLEFNCINVNHPPCTNAIALITIGTPAPPIITVESKSNVSCEGESDGSIDISVSGGQTPYSYSWIGPDGFTATTEDISGLKAGIYEVTVSSVCDTCFTNAIIEIKTLVDDQYPDIICPSDVTVNNDPGECGAVVTYVVPEGTDNCPGASIVQTAGLGSGAFFPEGTTTETYTVTDTTGNTASCSFTVTINDAEAPDITCPADVTLECPAADISTALTGEATGTDNCGSVTITYSDSSTSGCGNTEVITRTWTATDESGNSTSANQIITIADNTAPVITPPSDVILDCPADIAPVISVQPTVSDTCGAVNLSEDQTNTTGCPGTQVITRSWTATDECGNISLASQTISVVDTTEPVVSVIPQLTVILDANNVGSVVITPSDINNSSYDTCSNISLSISHTTLNCSNVGSNTVTLTVTDECENTNTGTTTVIVEDNIDGDPVSYCEGDCDDTDPNRYPGNTEYCDRVDNNCDGIVPADEVDNDNDGFTICEGDCNDDNMFIYPGAPAKGSSEDNDCSGRIEPDERRPVPYGIQMLTVNYPPSYGLPINYLYRIFNVPVPPYINNLYQPPHIYFSIGYSSNQLYPPLFGWPTYWSPFRLP